jgi:hypothetical protein
MASAKNAIHVTIVMIVQVRLDKRGLAILFIPRVCVEMGLNELKSVVKSNIRVSIFETIRHQNASVDCYGSINNVSDMANVAHRFQAPRERDCPQTEHYHIG